MSVVVFVDLDGTYVNCNSFHRWIRHLAGVKSPMRLWTKLELIAWVLARAARLITHGSLKYKIQKLFSELPKATQIEAVGMFVVGLERMTSKVVRDFCDRAQRERATLVLATAAPAEYAKTVAAVHGFNACLATQYTADQSEWREVYRGEKARVCKIWLEEHVKASRIIVVTDHIDDIELMRLSDVVIWCGQEENLGNVIARLPPVIVFNAAVMNIDKKVTDVFSGGM